MFIKYLVSVAIGALLVWLAFRGEDFSGFGERLEQVALGPSLAYLALFTIAHALRVVRWGVLIRALGPIRWRDIWSTGSVGYMCIMVFPLRLGEFVRPYLVRGMGGISASGALATVVVERVVDGLLFVALFFIFMSMLPPSGNPAVDAVKISGYLAGGVFLVALIVLVAAYVRRDQTVALVRRIGDRVHPRITHRAVGLLDAFLDGLRVLPDRRRLWAFIWMTILYWALLGVGMKLMADACNIPDLTYNGAFVLLAVVTVGIMIPAGPGFTGTFELAMRAGFALLIVSPASMENVMLYTILLHLSQLVVQVVFGLVFIVTGQIKLGDIFTARAPVPTPPGPT